MKLKKGETEIIAHPSKVEQLLNSGWTPADVEQPVEEPQDEVSEDGGL